MATSNDICNFLEEKDSRLGRCGENFDVHHDHEQKAYVIDYHDNNHHLKTFVDEEDVHQCLDEDKCLSLKLETGQLKYNFDKYVTEHSLENP